MAAMICETPRERQCILFLSSSTPPHGSPENWSQRTSLSCADTPPIGWYGPTPGMQTWVTALSVSRSSATPIVPSCTLVAKQVTWILANPILLATFLLLSLFGSCVDKASPSPRPSLGHTLVMSGPSIVPPRPISLAVMGLSFTPLSGSPTMTPLTTWTEDWSSRAPGVHLLALMKVWKLLAFSIPKTIPTFSKRVLANCATKSAPLPLALTLCETSTVPPLSLRSMRSCPLFPMRDMACKNHILVTLSFPIIYPIPPINNWIQVAKLMEFSFII